MTAGRIESAEETTKEPEPFRTIPTVSVRGKCPRVGEGPAGDPECGNEADPIGVESAVGSGLGHQGPNGIVATKVAPDLLDHQVGGLRPEHGTWPTLVGFEYRTLARDDLEDLRRGPRGGRRVTEPAAGSVYPVISLDVLVVKVKDAAQVRDKHADIAIGVDMVGIQACVGKLLTC